jgi:hypothetical protein
MEKPCKKLTTSARLSLGLTYHVGPIPIGTGFSSLKLIMEQRTEVEETVKRLCAEASTERNRSELRRVLARLKQILREHASTLRSMSEETYQALRKLKKPSVRHRVS